MSNSSIDNTENDQVRPLLDSFLHAFEEAKKYDLGIGSLNNVIKSLKHFHLELSKSQYCFIRSIPILINIYCLESMLCSVGLSVDMFIACGICI
jgi:hypothetical protein